MDANTCTNSNLIFLSKWKGTNRTNLIKTLNQQDISHMITKPIPNSIRIWKNRQSQLKLEQHNNNTLIQKRILQVYLNVVCCAIWYHSYNLKNVKNNHGGVLTLVKLQALACNFTKVNTPPWVFFTFFELYEWYQIAKRTTNSIFCSYKIIWLTHLL